MCSATFTNCIIHDIVLSYIVHVLYVAKQSRVMHGTQPVTVIAFTVTIYASVLISDSNCFQQVVLNCALLILLPLHVFKIIGLNPRALIVA